MYLPAPGLRRLSVTSHERWAAALTERAATYWTPARTDDLLRGKAVAIRPAEGAVVLRALGILDGDGQLPPQRVGKYFQVNHMIGTLAPTLADLRARHPRLAVIDAGCGRSYLSTALAWCGAQVWDYPLEVLGIDRNPAVIAASAERVERAGLTDRMRFAAAAVDGLDLATTWRARFGAELPSAIAVLGLHACDRASCDAIALGVAAGAELIAVAPCCQAELAAGWAALAEARADGALAPLWGAPHLRRETAAHVTDLMRLLLLRAAGYRATALEFVPHEHTRKNTLLRAVRDRADPDAAAAYRALCAATGGVGLALADTLQRRSQSTYGDPSCGKCPAP